MSSYREQCKWIVGMEWKERIGVSNDGINGDEGEINYL